MKKDILTVKNFWDNRPCNIKHSKKEIGTIEYFDEVEKRRYFVESHILKFAEFENSNSKNILEIGCGIGTDSVMFSKNGANLTAIDLSEKSINICKKRFEVLNLNADFLCGDAENLSEIVPNKKYDLIYSFGVIHHTPNPEKIIEEIKKISHKDTIIKIMMYSKFSWKTFEFFLRYGWKFNFNLKKTIQFFAEAQLGCPIANVYTEKELKKLLSDFEILKIEKKHIFQYNIKYYKKGILKKRLIFKILPKKLINLLESLLGWHYLITFKTKNI